VRVLLDTCIVSELRKADCSPAVKGFVLSLPSKSLFVSVITVGEITKGVALLREGRKKQALSAWLLGLSRQFEDRILGIDQETAEIWGELTAAAQKKGAGIPVADGLIAATAQRHGLHVATRNTPHFEAAGTMNVNPWLTQTAAVQ
jgi:predicted nucleic acid-binding protein